MINSKVLTLLKAMGKVSTEAAAGVAAEIDTGRCQVGLDRWWGLVAPEFLKSMGSTLVNNEWVLSKKTCRFLGIDESEAGVVDTSRDLPKQFTTPVEPKVPGPRVSMSRVQTKEERRRLKLQEEVDQNLKAHGDAYIEAKSEVLERYLGHSILGIPTEMPTDKVTLCTLAILCTDYDFHVMARDEVGIHENISDICAILGLDYKPVVEETLLAEDIRSNSLGARQLRLAGIMKFMQELQILHPDEGFRDRPVPIYSGSNAQYLYAVQPWYSGAKQAVLQMLSRGGHEGETAQELLKADDTVVIPYIKRLNGPGAPVRPQEALGKEYRDGYVYALNHLHDENFLNMKLPEGVIMPVFDLPEHIDRPITESNPQLVSQAAMNRINTLAEETNKTNSRALPLSISKERYSDLEAVRKEYCHGRDIPEYVHNHERILREEFRLMNPRDDEHMERAVRFILDAASPDQKQGIFHILRHYGQASTREYALPFEMFVSFDKQGRAYYNSAGSVSNSSWVRCLIVYKDEYTVPKGVFSRAHQDLPGVLQSMDYRAWFASDESLKELEAQKSNFKPVDLLNAIILAKCQENGYKTRHLIAVDARFSGLLLMNALLANPTYIKDSNLDPSIPEAVDVHSRVGTKVYMFLRTHNPRQLETLMNKGFHIRDLSKAFASPVTYGAWLIGRLMSDFNLTAAEAALLAEQLTEFAPTTELTRLIQRAFAGIISLYENIQSGTLTRANLQFLRKCPMIVDKNGVPLANYRFMYDQLLNKYVIGVPNPNIQEVGEVLRLVLERQNYDVVLSLNIDGERLLWSTGCVPDGLHGDWCTYGGQVHADNFPKMDIQRLASSAPPNLIRAYETAHMKAVTKRLTDMGIAHFTVFDAVYAPGFQLETIAEVYSEEFVRMFKAEDIFTLLKSIAPMDAFGQKGTAWDTIDSIPPMNILG